MSGADENFKAAQGSFFSTKNIIICVICIAVPVIVGLVSGYITRDNMVVFDSIKKPALTPPAIVFPIAWSILYVMMGIASFLALKNCRDFTQIVSVMIPYIIQLILNFIWSIIFFNTQSYGLALACLVLMWIMIVRSMITFATVSMIAGWFLLPYIIWVSFAAYLNVMIVIMN